MENYWYDNNLSLTTKLMISLGIKCNHVWEWEYETIEDFNLGKTYEESFDYRLKVLFNASEGSY